MRRHPQLKQIPLHVIQKTSIKEGLKAVRESPFKTVFVIDEAKKKSIFAITQNIPFVNESRKKGGGGGRPPLPPDPVTECCNLCISRGASGCLVDEHLGCTCLYDDGSGTDPRDVDTNDDLGSLLR